MLNPNVVETSEDIAASYSQFLAVRSFANSSGDIVVSPLSPDPDWLPPLRQRIAALAALGAKWRLDSPDILASYYLQFTNYATTFNGFAQVSSKFEDNVELWTEALTSLKSSMAQCRSNASTSENAFTDHLGEIRAVETTLDQSLDTAWRELATEENNIVALAKQVTRLQDRVAQLSDNLTSGTISSGKTYFQTAATISYTIISAGTADILPVDPHRGLHHREDGLRPHRHRPGDQ